MISAFKKTHHIKSNLHISIFQRGFKKYSLRWVTLYVFCRCCRRLLVVRRFENCSLIEFLLLLCCSCCCWALLASLKQCLGVAQQLLSSCSAVAQQLLSSCLAVSCSAVTQRSVPQYSVVQQQVA